MKIELQQIPVRDLVNGYTNNEEEGVVGYNGQLNIRPAYQREFIYKDKQRDAVIDTIRKGFPLNTMYWVRNEDGSFELLDGQQRTVSICEYIEGNFSLNFQYFHNLTDDEKNQILDYPLMVYVCEGSDKEKLDWFQVINIAGEKLTAQELRNAIYTGPWLSDAKRYFSRTGCPAKEIGGNYVKGSPIRQEYLEKAIKWITNNDSIEGYMAEHQHTQNANQLWLYFQNVIAWVNATFPNYRTIMKGVDWGILYNQFKDVNVNVEYLEDRISNLILDEDVTKNSGIYAYLLTGEEKHLNIRGFSNKQKIEAYERQGGICPICGEQFSIDEMEGDHITPWCEGGKTNAENCQMLCKKCNRTKGKK